MGIYKVSNSAAIWVETEEPDFSVLPVQEYDWSEIVYGNVQEEIARDLPDPLGNPVVLVSYVDTNLQDDMLTGRSVTGALHFFN
jgi:hypothetical protein